MEPYRDTHERTVETLDEFVVRHGQFHTAVASLARNRVLQLSLMVVGQIVTHHVAVNADPRSAATRSSTITPRSPSAILAGRPSRARRRMDAHIEAITDFYRTELGPQMSDIIEWR